MRRHWPIEKLHAHWMLLPEEKHLALAKRGALRLGFAVLLKFFHYEGRFPNEPREVPAVAVVYGLRASKAVLLYMEYARGAREAGGDDLRDQ